MSERIDALILPEWVIPVEPAGEALVGHAVAIHQGRIAAVLPRADAEARFAPETRIERPGHALIPGLVNAHTHAAMTLFRGYADDMPLREWLEGHIWPAEGRWVGPEFVRDGTELAMAELLRGGVTCFNDMYFFPDVVARTAAEVGIRCCVSMIVLDFPSVWAADGDEYITKGLAVRDEYKDHPLVDTCFGPHAPYTVSDEHLLRIRELSDELEVHVQMHVHETVAEIADAVAADGRRPLARLKELGLISPLLQAVHAIHLNQDEIAWLADAGAKVVHCPESNMKLASGLCPVAGLLEAGIEVAIGTDGAASNNDLDMFGEMRTTALLAKAVAEDASAVPAATALHMATLGGARSMGLGEDTGSIVSGKWADLVCVRLDTLEAAPCFDPISQLVYASGRHQVTDTWVAGRHLVSDGALTRIDTAALYDHVSAWRDRLRGT